MEVVLSEQELLQAAMAGVARQIESVSAGRADQYGAGKAFGWQMHVEGAAGELAVAKALNLDWTLGVGVFGGPDVGNLQVRTTHRDDGRLYLHPRDRPDMRYVLVTGLNGRYELRGWIYGWMGKLKKYWTEPQPGRPCYAVPQEDLRPIEAIMELTNGKTSEAAVASIGSQRGQRSR